VRKDLDLAEGRTEKEEHLDLESFMARQIQELREELECPVCLEVTSKAPIYKCSDDHLICRQCRPKLSECPQCRELYPEQLKRFRGAEKQGERLEALLEEKQALNDNSV